MTRAVPRSGVTQLRFPGAPPPLGAALLAQQFQFTQTERWPAQAVEALQFTQLSELLLHARTHAPYWRDALAGHELSAEALQAGAWQSLPILERAQAQEHQSDLRCVSSPPDHGARMPFATSGATGRPLAGEWTGLMQFFWGALNLRDHLWHDRDFRAAFAAIRTKVQPETLPNWGPAIEAAYTTGPAHTLPIHTPVSQQLAWLQAVDPAYLLSHASNLRGLLQETARSGSGPEHLRGVISFGEPTDAALRAGCQSLWGARLTDIYSCEEAGYLALECPATPGHYHVQAETVRLEVLDGRGLPCQEGEIGRVVITPLHNYATVLLRYALGDYAQLGGTCACGRTLPVLTRIAGRSRNLLRLPDGSSHWPSFPAEQWLAIAPVRRFQMVQHALEGIRVDIVVASPLTGPQREALTRMLRARLGHTFTIDYRELPDLPPQAGYKFEDFICELADAPANWASR